VSPANLMSPRTGSRWVNRLGAIGGHWAHVEPAPRASQS
jgi:hypothetical protein